MNMKKFIVMLMFILFSCSNTGDNRPPENLIPPDQMSMVMLDIILMKNIKRESYNVLEKKDLLVAEYLYEKYGIDSAQLASSQSYYAKNPKKYLPIFEKVKMKFKKLNDSIQQTMRIREE